MIEKRDARKSRYARVVCNQLPASAALVITPEKHLLFAQMPN